MLPKVAFDKAHIAGSAHISFYDDDFLELVAALAPDKGEMLVVYCLSAGCNASAKAAAKLSEAGYTNVFDFEGGVDEWEATGNPVVRRRSR